MAKLLKLRRGTTTQHASFTGAEGEVTVDTTKDTVVIHDGSQAGGRPLAREDMSNVSSASIAGRLGTGAIQGTQLENSGVNAGAYGSSSAIPIVTVDAQGLVTAASTTAIDSTTIANSNSSVAVAAGGDITLTRAGVTIGVIAGSGLNVTGNIAVSGTVDGVDVAALKTAKDSISTSNGAILSGVTATTQSAGDASTKIATTAYTDTAVSNLVDSSPGALNTLNELAAAINDDASFSTTMTNNLATKMPLAGGEFTGSIICENITPDGDSDRNLGNNTTRFEGVYADNFYGSGANLTGIVSFVSGMILIWSGAANAIPSGWVLCNGSNSTPNLMDRFVIGAQNAYGVGDTGGSTTISGNVNHSHSTPNHSHAVNNHTHSTPNHSHTVSNHSHSISGSVSGNTNNTGSHSHSINTSGGNSSDGPTGPKRQGQGDFSGYGTNSAGNHNHSFSGSFSGNSGNSAPNTTSSGASNTGNSAPNTTSSGSSNTGNSGSGSTVSVLNPYYALCYIMKT